MSAARIPLVGGVAGGCGTSLVAGLLGCTDIGTVAVGDRIDVLVCRSVSSHLTLATRIAIDSPTPPIVVVNADAPIRPPAQVRHRERMLEPNVWAVLRLDWIEPLRAMSDPIMGAREEVLTVPLHPSFRKAFEFRQRLVDQVVALLSDQSLDAPNSSAGNDDQPLRQTS